MADNSADTPKPTPPFEWVDTPAAEPIRVKARRWKQFGFDVLSAPCPVCQPGVPLPDKIHDLAASLAPGTRRPTPPAHLHIHVNQPGRIICKCGAYLELYVEGEGG